MLSANHFFDDISAESVRRREAAVVVLSGLSDRRIETIPCIWVMYVIDDDILICVVLQLQLQVWCMRTST